MENPSGISFPFRFSQAGGVKLASGVEKVEGNLKALATTAVKERLIRKNVGTVGYQAVLRNQTDATRKAIRDLVWEAIVRHERRAKLLSLTVTKASVESGTGILIEGTFIFRQTGLESTFRAQIS